MLLPKSKTFQPLDIAGAVPSLVSTSAKRSLRQFSASLTVKLVLLAGIFIALPVAMYKQFETADLQRRDLVIRSIQHRNAVIAQGLATTLRDLAPAKLGDLNNELL